MSTNNTTRKPVLSAKQCNDLMAMIKAVAISAGEFVATPPHTAEKDKRRLKYQEDLENVADYIRALSEAAPPPIVPPEAAP